MREINNEVNANNLDPVDTHLEKLNSQVVEVLQELEKDCPFFMTFYLETLAKGGKIEDIIGVEKLKLLNFNHPVRQLRTYVNSLHDACWQVMYSKQRLNACSEWRTLQPSSHTLINFYVSYYFSGFIAAVKTVTDILGLTINHIFQLEIPAKNCGLNKGLIANKMLDKFSNQQGNSTHIKKLSQKLEQARNNWIQDFYELRNMVTHRGEILFGPTSIQVLDNDAIEHPFYVEPVPSNPELFEFAKRVADSSIISDTANGFIDPIIFCTEIWKKLSKLLEQSGNMCLYELDAFYSGKKSP